MSLLQLLMILPVLLSLAPPDPPPLQDGDLVFQTSSSGQSAAVLAATGHPFTHIGIVRMDGDKALVVQAWDRVIETPLDDWQAQGDDGKIAIYRFTGLDADAAAAIVQAAQAYEGQPYDIFFAFDNGAMYCSELPYLAFQTVGISIGQVERLGDLNVDDATVQALIAARWQQDPTCAAQGLEFDACRELLMDRTMITPAAIALDPQFTILYSNF